jgi:hypothetical protein
MKRIQLIGVVSLLILVLAATGTASSDTITDVSRFFYNGDGKIKLLSAKNGI